MVGRGCRPVKILLDSLLESSWIEPCFIPDPSFGAFLIRVVVHTWCPLGGFRLSRRQCCCCVIVVLVGDTLLLFTILEGMGQIVVVCCPSSIWTMILTSSMKRLKSVRFWLDLVFFCSNQFIGSLLWFDCYLHQGYRQSKRCQWFIPTLLIGNREADHIISASKFVIKA